VTADPHTLVAADPHTLVAADPHTLVAADPQTHVAADSHTLVASVPSPITFFPTSLPPGFLAFLSVTRLRILSFYFLELGRIRFFSTPKKTVRAASGKRSPTLVSALAADHF